MGIIVDIVLIAFLALSIFLGYKKGLAQLAIKLCAFIIAILITFILYRPVGNLIINTTSIDESIEDAIYNKVTQMIQEDNENELTSGLIESAKQGMLPEAARELTINIIYGGTAIILFIITRIALIFISALANLIAKLPIIKQFNEVGGAVYGLLRGLVIIYAILIVISFIGQINPKNIVTQTISESTLGRTMYENNIFNVFFK